MIVKRLTVCIIITAMLITIIGCSSTLPVSGRISTDSHIMQMLFGDYALTYETKDEVQMILSAIYLCCEQADGKGQEQLDFLQSHKVKKTPSLSEINISKDEIFEYSHKSWDYLCPADTNIQKKRKNILINTVGEVFDFGKSSEKKEHFAAFLYCLHILSDYLGDEANDTQISVNDCNVHSYIGEPYTTLNGNIPTFSEDEKKNTVAFERYQPLDNLGRAGTAFVNIDKEKMLAKSQRANIENIKPSGWQYDKYEGLIASSPAYLFNRCHLIAHELSGVDEDVNLITGTRYLNISGMKPFEDRIAKYVKESGNHVLYRATPVYKGSSLVASGVHLEAYSVEDSGEGIQFNVYCYNIQPGISISYSNGISSRSDITVENDNIIPFSILNADEENPDLLYEIKKHLNVIFNDLDFAGNYSALINKIDTIAINARMIGDKGENAAQCYLKLKEYKYELYDALKTYIPLLLQNEDFFNDSFNIAA